MRVVDIEPLLTVMSNLEAEALEQVKDLTPFKDPVGFAMWFSILHERMAFKHDLMTAQVIDIKMEVHDDN